MQRSHLKWVLAPVILLAGSQFSRAEVIIDITQQGSNVVSTASGTLDITDLGFDGSGASFSLMNPSNAAAILGPSVLTNDDVYDGITGPSSFGTGSASLADSGSGDRVGVVETAGAIQVPQGYVSGATLSSTSTYDNQTLATLGLTPGTYKYTWGIGAHADSLTVQIGPAAPLPSAFGGGSAGLILLAGWAWRQRRGAAV